MSFFKIAAKNLGRAKSRTVLTVLAIGLGTALLAGITILNDSYLDSYLDGVSDELGFTDLGYKRHLNVSDGYFNISDFKADTSLENIEGYEGSTGRIVEQHFCTKNEPITEAQAFTTTFFGIDLIEDKGYGDADILTVSAEATSQLSGTPNTIEEILSLNESYVVISTWVKDVYDFQLDDTILIPHRIDISTDFDNSSTWNRYKVVAIINDFGEGRDVGFDYSKNDTTSSLRTRAMYFNISQVRKMINLTTLEVNLLYVHVNLAKIQTVYDAIQEALPADYYGHNIKSGELEKVYDSIQSMQMILIIFTLISFIIAIMLTLNTLMMSVAEQKYEVGVLRAQGIYKSEIFKMFLSEALILSLSGSLIGIGMGLGLSPLLKNIFFDAMMADSSFDLVITFNFMSILLIFGISFLISLFIGILPAYMATKIQIIEAIRGVSSGKKGKKIKKVIFPAVGVLMTAIGYVILLGANNQLHMTLIGIIPFIFGLIILSTILIPILSKGFSYVFAFFLGPFRQVTNQNLKRDPRQTKITFVMFGLAIGFLVMVSNTLNSLEIVQNRAVPRFLGADILVTSEGSTFGMDEILIADADIIKGSVERAALVNAIRIKVDDFGTWYSDLNDEPRVNMYIVEGEKFIQAINNETKMYGNQVNQELALFTALDNIPNSVIITKQLADANHLNKEVGEKVTLDIGGGFEIEATIIGITDFVSGFSESWEEPSDITPASSRGKYAIWTSWQSVIPFIDQYIAQTMPIPELDIVVKGDDHDFDYWDFTFFNATEFRNNFTNFLVGKEYENHVTIAERVWDEEKKSIAADSSLNTYNDVTTFGNLTHVAFEDTSLNGTTTFIENGKRHAYYLSVQDALDDGEYQCVITSDINASLGLGVDDVISVWYYNSTYDINRQNFTIAGVIDISSSIEAVNFNSLNPYVEGEWDVAADDSSAVIVKLNSTVSWGAQTKTLSEDLMNNTGVFEFWIAFDNTSLYFKHHLKAIRDMQDYFGSDFVFADMRWLFTQEFSYAPQWMIKVADGYDQEETLEKIKEFLLLNRMPVISWMTVDGVREAYSDEIEFQKGFFNIVLSFALIIAVLGIMINMLISISNRKREIGMMRAIGTYKKEMMKMILGETLILVFSGFLIGAIMGTLSANQLVLGLPLDAVFNLRLFIDWGMIGILFIVVFIVSIAAAALPIYRVMKLDVIEAVRAV